MSRPADDPLADATAARLARSPRSSVSERLRRLTCFGRPAVWANPPRAALAALAAMLVAVVAACGGGSGGSGPEPAPIAPPETTEYGAETSTKLAFDIGTVGVGPGPLSFALTSAPDGLQVDEQSGRVEWVPQADQIGEHAIGVTVVDASGARVTKTYRVEVNAPADAAPYLVLRTDGVAYTRGQPIRASWRLGGEPPPGASIELGVEAPEVDGTAAEGSPTAWFLGAQGNWSTAPVRLQDAARAGQATLTLPSRVAGAWRITTRLLDADGGPLATMASRVLVADVPTLRLTLNRPLANPLDTVRAVVDLAAGATPVPIRLMAWMVQPDGRKLGLPSLDPNELEVGRGDTDSGRHVLLERAFTAAETGEYRILTRLYAAADGRLLQEASAKFSVCAAASALSGRVRKPDRSPVDGPTMTQAVVQVLDIDDGAVTETATLASDGGYTLTLPPGRYIVTARALDPAGAAFEADDAAVLLGCAPTALSRDFQLRTR